MKTYTVTDGKLTLELQRAGGGYYAVSCPDDPQLLTQAKTLEEAFDMAYDAQSALNEVRRKLGKSSPGVVPSPKSVPKVREKPGKSEVSTTLKLESPKAIGRIGQKTFTDVMDQKGHAKTVAERRSPKKTRTKIESGNEPAGA